MSKKKLPMDGIVNELEGASLFFSPQPDSPPPISKPLDPAVEQMYAAQKETVKSVSSKGNDLTEHAMMNANTHASKQGSTHASTQASMQASTHADMKAREPNDFIKAIRKTVRRVGKEALYLRITPEEKQVLGSFVHSFNELHRGEDFTTSENEIGRIAINFLFEDYQTNGGDSMLTRTLAALQA